MSPDKWQEISRIFNAVLEKEPFQRKDFVAEACGGDAELRDEIEILLSAHESGDSFIDSPEAGLIQDFPTLDLKKGDKIDAFEIEKLLGRGGMGEVYLARDTRLNRPVAVKILPPATASNSLANKRLLREAQAAAALEHPHICTIHEIVEAEGFTFIVMQYVEGETLSDILQNGALDIRRALKIALQITEAIADAHRHKIIHRDIKPANIVVSSNDQVKVLDFGLAKRLATEEDNDKSTIKSILSQPGLILGTASYMSPEQARGLEVDSRTDLWSLGIVLYEMTCGKKPFEGETLADKFVSILHDKPEFPTNFNPEQKKIILRLLEKDYDKRFQTADELLQELKTLRREVEFEEQLKTHITVDSGSHILEASFLSSGEEGEKTLMIVENKPKTFWQKIGWTQFVWGSLVLILIGIAKIFYLGDYKKLTETEKINFWMLAVFVETPLILAFVLSWIFPVSIWGTRHLIIIFAPVFIAIGLFFDKIKPQILRIVLLSGLFFLFALAFLFETKRPNQTFIWCAWENLAGQIPNNQPTKIYVFEDLVAYHFWLAERNDPNIQIIKIENLEGVQEDKAYFLPRGFDDVKKINFDEISDKTFYIAFRDENFDLQKSPLKNLSEKGYKIGKPKTFEAQGLKAFLIEVKK